jgi:hypothetical protein
MKAESLFFSSKWSWQHVSERWVSVMSWLKRSRPYIFPSLVGRLGSEADGERGRQLGWLKAPKSRGFQGDDSRIPQVPDPFFCG